LRKGSPETFAWVKNSTTLTSSVPIFSHRMTWGHLSILVALLGFYVNTSGVKQHKLNDKNKIKLDMIADVVNSLVLF
jgi:hypothetical protein